MLVRIKKQLLEMPHESDKLKKFIRNSDARILYLNNTQGYVHTHITAKI